MSDDLSKLTPTDPSSVDPQWHSKRASILADVLVAKAPRHSSALRWVAGVAAAALVIVAVGGITQQLRREPWATPASPTPTTGTARTDLVAAQSRVIFKGGGAILCRASLIPSPYPLGCDAIPVQGLSPQEVPWTEQADGAAWADVIVTGTFDGTTLHAVDVYRTDDDTAPRRDSSLGIGGNYDGMGQLCQDPVMGHGPGDRPLGEVERELTTYQGSWGRDPYNVAVTGDVESARNTLVEYVEGEFCVAALPGPSAANGHAAEARAQTVSGVEWADYSALDHGASLQVTILVDDAEVRAALETAVGQEVWPSTDVASFFYPATLAEPSPTANPASPTATPPYAHGDPVEITGWITVTDGVMGLCYGGGSMGVGMGRDPIEFTPPECVDSFLPVTGIPMPEFTNLYGTVVGTFDGSVLDATRWYGGNWRTPGSFVPDEYSSHSYSEPPQTVDICDYQPGRGSLTGERVSPSDPSALDARARALPGYQGWWTEYDENSEDQGPSGPPVVGYRVAVTHGAEAAQETLLENSAFPLCVGTVPGPDEATLVAAMERVDDILFPHVEGKATLFDGEGSGVVVDETGARLEIVILAETTDVTAAVREAVGPEVWQWTDIRPRLETVDPAALEPAPDAPVVMPSGPTTSLSITDDDRSRAEAVVATDLQAAAGTSASATMAKATFEQFEALWPIDWEAMRRMHRRPDMGVQGAPLPADAEVLLVALSAPLSEPYIAAVPASDERGPSKNAGTINVIDASTGDLIIHVTVAGGKPGDRLTELPGPREDVTLPKGFR